MTTPFAEDSPGSCEMTLGDFPERVIPFVRVDMDGQELARLEDCAEEPDTFAGLGGVWLVEGEALQLCEAACAAFGSGEVETLFSWGCPSG